MAQGVTLKPFSPSVTPWDCERVMTRERERERLIISNQADSGMCRQRGPCGEGWKNKYFKLPTICKNIYLHVINLKM